MYGVLTSSVGCRDVEIPGTVHAKFLVQLNGRQHLAVMLDLPLLGRSISFSFAKAPLSFWLTGPTSRHNITATRLVNVVTSSDMTHKSNRLLPLDSRAESRFPGSSYQRASLRYLKA